MPTEDHPHKANYRLSVLAPSDGLMHPLQASASGVMRSLAGFGFCLLPEKQQLVSPCSGHASLHFLPHPCIRIHHTSGLQCRMDMPLHWLDRHGQGLDWQWHQGHLKAGQVVLDLDPAWLKAKAMLSVAFFPHPAIQPKPLPNTKAVLSAEPCFFINITGKHP